MMANLSKQRGLNAVELMTTLAIVGVLTAVAMPGMQSLVAAQRVKAASSDLHTSLLLARSEAIKRNANVELSPSANGWAGGWTVSDGSDTAIEVQGARANLAISGPDAITYNGNGRLEGGEAGEFELSGDATENVRCVAIDLSGRPAIKNTAC